VVLSGAGPGGAEGCGGPRPLCASEGAGIGWPGLVLWTGCF